MSKHTEQAAGFYAGGCNCAQASFVPFAVECGLDEDAALRLSSSLGGGIGGMKEMCGALTGSFLALGLTQGYGKGCTADQKQAHAARVRALAEKFKGEFGWVNCRDLLQRNEVDGSAAKEARPCMKYVLAAVSNLETALEEHQ